MGDLKLGTSKNLLWALWCDLYIDAETHIHAALIEELDTVEAAVDSVVDPNSWFDSIKRP